MLKWTGNLKATGYRNSYSKILLNGILVLRFFAIALNLYTTTINHFLWLPPWTNYIKAWPSYSSSFLLPSTLIRLFWCSAQSVSTNLTYISSSHLDASKDGLGTCLKLWHICHMLAIMDEGSLQQLLQSIDVHDTSIPSGPWLWIKGVWES